MLTDLKLMLGIASQDTSLDDKLNLIISMTEERLKALLCDKEPPESMKHIILEVSIIRFNRIGSEGLTSHTVEGESLSFSNDDFAEYADEIQTYLDTQNDVARGRLRFL
ncbi:MAG: phage head-tail connector protein [Lachnospiraceae bacterium]